MVLERIDGPADLAGLGPMELATLADELRAAIIAAVSQVGGHLGSNLGVVELTIALHRVFDSPRDLLVWDTGHQAYVHKLLTGRRADFATLRRAGGLSGYPARAESMHDVVENSHASTALSWAAGLVLGATAGAGSAAGRVVAVVGDGALTGGMAYEALNNIGHHRIPVVIVLNDNGRSYAETVSGLSEARATQSFVEALGVRYLGPYDGHDVARLEQALAQARRSEGPVLVHALTRKGSGYAPAESDPEKKLHDTSAFDVATGRAAGPKQRTWTQVFSEVMVELGAQHPDLIALTAAMPGSTGLLPFGQRHPDRLLDVGIAEQHAVTQAAGLARAGRRPVVAVYSTFFARAFDQANLDVGLHGEHVVFALDRAGITGDDGPSHHGILDLALGLRIAGLSVFVPSHEEDLAALLRVAVARDEPALVRFAKGAVPTREQLLAAGPAGTEVAAVDGTDARRLVDGGDVCILAIGDRVVAALEASRTLRRHGIDAAVWDVRSVRPLDPRLIAAAAAAPLVVTVENGVVGGGAGAELGDRIVEFAGLRQAPPVLRLGVPAAYLAQGEPDRILAELGLDAAGIVSAVRKVASTV